MHRLTRIVMALVFIATMLVAAGVQAAPSQAGTAQNYLVLYKGNAVAADAIAKAGGTIVARYDKIGVAVVSSSNANFAATVRKDSRVEGASATAGFGIKMHDQVADGASAAVNTPVDDLAEPLFGLQWDMVQIHTPEAHAITGGSPTVVVGDLDTGLDFTHPDLAANYDPVNSADCSSGAPQPLAVGNDQNGHGTHTAGTIAAAANGIGIVGVAPNVKIAGIKSSNDDGFFFPEMVICSFMWAADHVHVTNNSYFADPWLFNCRNDAEQRAIWKAERRAIRYAMSKGVVVVASEGNDSTDLSHPRVDIISPDFPPGSAQEREITNACAVVPVEVPGVIGVTATSNRSVKSYYSSYGVSTADVAAPGGDSLFFDQSANVPDGRVLSTWPAALIPASRTVQDPASGAWYRYLQGTSMAGPHVAGVAALVLSQRKMSPGAVAARIGQSATPLACPPNPFLFPAVPQNSGEPQTCQGGTGHNSFYGSGEVNAYKAIR
jgi:lantibiotic leader peptide-processing serine protease